MRGILAALLTGIGLQSLGFAETEPETLEALRRIDAPQVVGVPPENACRGLRGDARRRDPALRFRAQCRR